MHSVRSPDVGGKDLKGRAGLLALSLLLLTLVPMWAAVIGEIRHERVLTEAVARKDAMNLATAFEAHVRSVIRQMDMILLDMRLTCWINDRSSRRSAKSSRRMAASSPRWR